MSSSRNYLDNSRSRNWVFKRQQYYACDNFHIYKRCYYLFSNPVSEAWVPRSEIKKMIKKVLNKDKNFTDEIKQLQAAKKKKKKKEDWLLLRNINKIELTFLIKYLS